ncbi:MAG: bifunctional diaminohydroxyphosphoribosylaminopyrimidine deaminase/5-amino-6-(5-phosphoribosylamino)uracil reductase RibD [Phycisphaerales bacterium]|jgi:diaminohydroxyphosphoribosylaminopyrimidine deaminase/5-amino-6-(5-phosphoribosylamino)uracil reductase|nr:bifunctional diaminohydroxyphosphoribosylaminopyrimidine deaminase/5-amino-6-(5-phosphoribosylamino)uracil reductase RibD [Phycisphaerales bacterium]
MGQEEWDQLLMGRAVEEAMRGRGGVEPNPMVGCVIGREGRIIGLGHHQRYGGPHAERVALGSCGESTFGASAYVTLEPCCHLNKRTPPCVPALIEAGIGEVVVGCIDPNPLVRGGGIEQLRAAGVAVRVGVMEEVCRQLIAPYVAGVVHHRPYVTMKWAQSADGKIAGPGGVRLQISNEESMRMVHRLRAKCDGILVGIGTVLSDDPMLVAKDQPDARPLIRYVLDRRLEIPLESKLVRSARESAVVVACENEAIAGSKADQLRQMGVQLLEADSIAAVLSDAHKRRITHLLVEPGPRLARAFFDGGWVDRLWVFQSQLTINDPAAPTAATIPDEYQLTGSTNLHGDELTEYLNPRSNVFFHPSASADFHWAKD